jgi:hypothetical protein
MARCPIVGRGGSEPPVSVRSLVATAVTGQRHRSRRGPWGLCPRERRDDAAPRCPTGCQRVRSMGGRPDLGLTFVHAVEVCPRCYPEVCAVQRAGRRQVPHDRRAVSHEESAERRWDREMLSFGLWAHSPMATDVGSSWPRLLARRAMRVGCSISPRPRQGVDRGWQGSLQGPAGDPGGRRAARGLDTDRGPCARLREVPGANRPRDPDRAADSRGRHGLPVASSTFSARMPSGPSAKAIGAA